MVAMTVIIALRRLRLRSTTSLRSAWPIEKRPCLKPEKPGDREPERAYERGEREIGLNGGGE